MRRVAQVGMGLGAIALAAVAAATTGGGPPREAYEAAPVPDGATLRGRVVFDGAVPVAETFLITKDHAACGSGHVERQEVRAAHGALRDVVVSLQAVGRGKPWPAVGSHAVDQRQCAFHPTLQVVPAGAELAIVNSDPVLHNIHAYEVVGRARRTLFNLAQPKSGERLVRTVNTRRSEVVRLECDAHNWMLGWLYVADHPYYAVVGENGTFAIDDIPPGTYRVRAWHPALGVQEREITLGARGHAELAFHFTGK